MTLSRLHISTFLGLAVLVWWLVLLIRGTPVTWDHLAPFGSVVTVLSASVAVFERLLWRHPWLHGWFVKRPDLRGTWRVELVSDWVDQTNPGSEAVRIGYMGVEQTLSTLRMHLMTRESESWLIAESIRPSPTGDGYQVAGVYTNQPNILLRRTRSEMHRGAFVLTTYGPPNRPHAMEGEYWTDRKTVGRMVLTRRVQKVFARFEDAERTFASEVEMAAPLGATPSASDQS